MELKKDDYLVGIWFSSDPLTHDSWLGWLIRDCKDKEEYRGYYRFRYKEDEKIFDSKDEKNKYAFTAADCGKDEYIKLMENMQRLISPKYTYIDNIIVEGNIDKLLSLAKDKEWLHIKEAETNDML